MSKIYNDYHTGYSFAETKSGLLFQVA